MKSKERPPVNFAMLTGLSKREQAIVLFRAGRSIKQVAQVLGVPYEVVRYWRHGGELNKHDYYKREQELAGQAR